MNQINLDSIVIDIKLKNIKNIYLRIYPPDGNVKITAPKKMPIEKIYHFAFQKQQWIKNKQVQIKKQTINKSYQFISNEIHYFLGKAYYLMVFEQKSSPKIILQSNTIELYIKPNTSMEKRKQILDKWYREQFQQIIPTLFEKWEAIIGVKSNEVRIKKMRTKWGTCNIHEKRIWLNLELIKKPTQCIEYVIVHELIHLLERHHNKRFYSLMTMFMPKWKNYKNELNNSNNC